jgi:hypothetical protein
MEALLSPQARRRSFRGDDRLAPPRCLAASLCPAAPPHCCRPPAAFRGDRRIARWPPAPPSRGIRPPVPGVSAAAASMVTAQPGGPAPSVVGAGRVTQVDDGVDSAIDVMNGIHGARHIRFQGFDLRQVGIYSH